MIKTFLHYYSRPFDREAINESKRNEKMASAGNGIRLALLTAASCAVGFVAGVEWFANALRKEFAKRKFLLS